MRRIGLICHSPVPRPVPEILEPKRRLISRAPIPPPAAPKSLQQWIRAISTLTARRTSHSIRDLHVLTAPPATTGLPKMQLGQMRQQAAGPFVMIASSAWKPQTCQRRGSCTGWSRIPIGSVCTRNPLLGWFVDVMYQSRPETAPRVGPWGGGLAKLTQQARSSRSSILFETPLHKLYRSGPLAAG